MRLFAFWEQLLQDVRYAVRVLARQPLFTAMALLSLALGIGANTAIYSFMDAILLRALPVRNPESLVVLNWHGGRERPAVVHSLSGNNFTDPKTGYTSGNFPLPAFELLRANSPQFSSLFAFSGAGRLTVLVQGQADLANGRLDAIEDDIVVLQQFLDSPEGACCKILGQPSPQPVEIFGPGAGIAVRKGETDLVKKLNSAIDAIRANGKYKEINDKYFKFDVFGAES